MEQIELFRCKGRKSEGLVEGTYLIVNNQTREGYLAEIGSVYNEIKMHYSFERMAIVRYAYDAIKIGLIDKSYIKGEGDEIIIGSFLNQSLEVKREKSIEKLFQFFSSQELKETIKSLSQEITPLFDYNDFQRKAAENLPQADKATQERLIKEKEEDEKERIAKQNRDMKSRVEVKTLICSLLEQNRFADAQALCEGVGQPGLFQAILEVKYSFPLPK